MASQASPLAVDPYGRFMVEAFDDRQVIGVPTAFQAFFGRPETGARTLFSPNASVVDIDIIRGNERLAKMIVRGGNARPISGQQNTNEGKWSSFSRLYPLIEEEGDIDAEQLNMRVAGENPYQNMTKLDRIRALALRHHQEHVRRTVRLFEYLAAQSVLTGTMPAIFGTVNTDLIYDFQRLATHTFAVPIGWNQTTAVIMTNVDAACNLIRADAHVSPDMMILSGDSMDAFLKDSVVLQLADNRRFELIEVSTGNPVPSNFSRFVEAGLTPRGRLRTPEGFELWMFTYKDVYTADNGDATKYMPDGKVLVAYSGARCDRYFGPSEVLPMTAGRQAWYQEMFGFNPTAAPMPPNIKNMANAVNPAMFYFDAYPAPNMKTVTLRSQSAPIFATTMTDAFVLMTGTIT